MPARGLPARPFPARSPSPSGNGNRTRTLHLPGLLSPSETVAGGELRLVCPVSCDNQSKSFPCMCLHSPGAWSATVVACCPPPVLEDKVKRPTLVRRRHRLFTKPRGGCHISNVSLPPEPCGPCSCSGSLPPGQPGFWVLRASQTVHPGVSSL